LNAQQVCKISPLAGCSKTGGSYLKVPLICSMVLQKSDKLTRQNIEQQQQFLSLTTKKIQLLIFPFGIEILQIFGEFWWKFVK